MNFADLIIPAIVTPAVLYVAMVAQRFAGPVSAGLVASLPLQSAIGAIGVSATSGDHAVADFSVIAATYISAQVAYAVAFTYGMHRAGIFGAVSTGLTAYSIQIFILGHLPVVIAVALGFVSIAIGPKLTKKSAQDRAVMPPAESNSAIVVVLGTLGVLSVILLVQLAGPKAGAFMAAVPVITPILAYFLSRSQGRAAGAETMTGLIKGLPMYSTFSIATAFLSVPLGTEIATGIGMTLCLAIAAFLWRIATANAAANQEAYSTAA
jgi:hypothetical protein